MDDRDDQNGMHLRLASHTQEDFRRITAKAERSARIENTVWLFVLGLSSMCIGALAIWMTANAAGVCL